LDEVRQVARYWGETEAEREAAFQADAASRAAAGWRMVSRITQWPIGKPGLDLVATYELGSDSDPDPGSGSGFGGVSAVAVPAERGRRATGARSTSAVGRSRPRRAGAGRPDWGIARFFMAAGSDEPPIARTLRRTLLFGGLAVGLAISMVAVKQEPPGHPIPSQYPAMAVVCICEALIGVGLSWYLFRWRRIPVVFRLIGVLILALLVATAVVDGHLYAIGQVPTHS
jgi:hypothetical protein